MHNNGNAQQKNMSPVAAGITGLILGIVGTAAIALSDKDTRRKVGKKANEVKDNLKKWSEDTLHEWQATGAETHKKSLDSAEEAKNRIEDSLKEDQRKEV